MSDINETAKKYNLSPKLGEEFCAGAAKFADSVYEGAKKMADKIYEGAQKIAKSINPGAERPLDNLPSVFVSSNSEKRNGGR